MYKITFVYRMVNGHKTALNQGVMHEAGETAHEAVSRLREELEMEGLALVTVLKVEEEVY